MGNKTTYTIIAITAIIAIGAIGGAISGVHYNPIYLTDNTSLTRIEYVNTTGILYITNNGNVSITNNEKTAYQTLKAGTILSGDQLVCLANGTNCQAIGGSTTAGGWTNTTTTTTTSLNVTISSINGTLLIKSDSSTRGGITIGNVSTRLPSTGFGLDVQESKTGVGLVIIGGTSVGGSLYFGSVGSNSIKYGNSEIGYYTAQTRGHDFYVVNTTRMPLSINGSGIYEGTGTYTGDQGLCRIGATRQIGYCTTAINSSGGCTCTALATT